MADKFKLISLIEEEMAHPEVNQELLDQLRSLVAEGTPSLYQGMDVATRNTLNAFFSEIHDHIFNELVSGKYGARIVIDAAIVLAFETGYKIRERRDIVPPL
jgi:hypothetical protein